MARTATPAELRKAFHALSKKLHPDKNPDDTERAQAAFRRIKDAHECLADERRRAHYDKMLVGRDRVMQQRRQQERERPCGTAETQEL